MRASTFLGAARPETTGHLEAGLGVAEHFDLGLGGSQHDVFHPAPQAGATYEHLAYELEPLGGTGP